MFGYFMNDVFTFVVKPLKFWSQQHALDAPVLYTTSSTSLHNGSLLLCAGLGLSLAKKNKEAI